MTTSLRWIVVGFGAAWLSVVIVSCTSSGAEDSGVADSAGGRSATTVVFAVGGGGIQPNTTTNQAGAPAIASSCRAPGDACADGTQCCTGRCDFGVCLGQTGLCSANGTNCAASAECCSGRCESSDTTDKRCVPSATMCRFGGEVCATNGDCCSGVCASDGHCPVFAQCQTAGEPCTGHHECCTGVCSDPGTGTAVCQYVSGCRPIGEVCNTDGDCCSSSCLDDGTSGVKRCDKPAGCMWPGEVCWNGQAANCCPQGRTGGNALCLASVLGVSRCFTAGTPDACLTDGSPCAFADECCGGICLADSTGTLRCGSECVRTGESCTASADCCDGPCVLGRCVPNELGCVALGQSCANNAECCSQLCSASGVCTTSITLL